MTAEHSSAGTLPPGDPAAEAAAWVIRHGGAPLSMAERQDFAAWLARGPAEREAWDFARETWQGLADLPPDLLETRPVAPPMTRRHWPAALAAGLAALAVAVGLLYGGNPLPWLMADYTAPRHALRLVDLPDGSQAELAPGSAIRLAYDADSRRIHLLRGEAYFIVTPLETAGQRPFTVEAGPVSATALGTRFSVDLQGEGVEVVVSEHEVAVAHQGAAGTVLNEGQAALFTAGAGTPLVRAVDPELSHAWRRGLLIFDNRPLGEVIAELNRYRHGQIVLRSPTLAARRVSGVIDTADIANAVDRIRHELDLGLISLPPLVTILY